MKDKTAVGRTWEKRREEMRGGGVKTMVSRRPNKPFYSSATPRVINTFTSFYPSFLSLYISIYPLSFIFYYAFNLLFPFLSLQLSISLSSSSFHCQPNHNFVWVSICLCPFLGFYLGFCFFLGFAWGVGFILQKCVN